HPAVQPLAELRDVCGGVFGKSKMRQKQTVWFALQNPCEGGIPERQVDVRRRRGRHHVRLPFDAYPCRVTHEGDALDVLEIADVVRGVAWRVGHLAFPGTAPNWIPSPASSTPHCQRAPYLCPAPCINIL